MLHRCVNTKNARFKDYGGRGITVCESWKGSFESFINDMGRRPSKEYSLDRIDNDKGYSPENCRWTTRKEQQRNMRSNITIEYLGQTKCLAEWSEITGIPQCTITTRIKRGWSEKEAITQPHDRRNNRNSRMLTYNGQTKCMKAWSESLGMPLTMLRGRINRGWSINLALEKPFPTFKNLLK